MRGDFGDIAEIGKYYIHYKNGTKKPVMYSLTDHEVLVRMSRFAADDVISDLELKRWKVWKHIKEVVFPSYQKEFEVIVELGEAHAIPHKHPDKYWLFGVNKYDGRTAIGFDWVDSPDEILNIDEGQKYYWARKRLDMWHGWAGNINAVFKYAVDKWVAENQNMLIKKDGVECLIVNGRKYLFNRIISNGYVMFHEFSFPTAYEDQTYVERIMK